MGEITFESFDKTFLRISSIWLNDLEIQKLIMGSPPTDEQQEKWFLSLTDRQDYFIWGIKSDNHPIGVVGLKHVDQSKRDAEYFGYIGEKIYWGRGIGKEMMKFAENKAREMSLLSVYLNVKDENIRAIHLYESFGFVIKNKHDNVIFMRRLI